LYAPARDVEALSRQIERALEDEDARLALRAAGQQRAARFRWEDAARDTAAALAEAARGEP
jgi:glycosyltransferase involved in cell wall biosynthesis